MCLFSHMTEVQLSIPGASVLGLSTKRSLVRSGQIGSGLVSQIGSDRIRMLKPVLLSNGLTHVGLCFVALDQSGEG